MRLVRFSSYFSSSDFTAASSPLTAIVTSKRPLTFWRTALAMLAGLAVLYAVGVPYLALIANAYLGKGLTFWQVLKNGMLIYLPGDLLKIAFGSFLCVAITRRLPQLFAAPQAE